MRCDLQDPQSLHKYLYVHGDPVNNIGPTGEFVGLVLLSWRAASYTTIGVLTAGLIGLLARNYWYFRPATYNSARRGITSYTLLTDAAEKLAAARNHYHRQSPALYNAMTLDNLFDSLDDAAMHHVSHVVYDPTLREGADAEYNFAYDVVIFRTLDISRVDRYTLVHEFVHAADDQHGWNADERTQEGIAYATMYVLYMFFRIELSERLVDDGRRADAQAMFDEVWDEYEHGPRSGTGSIVTWGYITRSSEPLQRSDIDRATSQLGITLDREATEEAIGLR